MYKRQVTDVGSTKTAIHETVIALDMEECFVGGHPMAGSERTGYACSKASLLENAYYVITPTSKTTNDQLDTMIQFAADQDVYKRQVTDNSLRISSIASILSTSTLTIAPLLRSNFT